MKIKSRSPKKVASYIKNNLADIAYQYPLDFIAEFLKCPFWELKEELRNLGIEYNSVREEAIKTFIDGNQDMDPKDIAEICDITEQKVLEIKNQIMED